MIGVAVLMMTLFLALSQADLDTDVVPEPLYPEKCPAGSFGFIADPDDCKYYYDCPTGKKYECEEGLVFDKNTNGCNHQDFVTCYSGVSCPSPNGLFAHPTNCNKFLNCFEDIAHVQSCPPGLWFNQDKDYCDYPKNVKCDAATYKP